MLLKLLFLSSSSLFLVSCFGLQTRRDMGPITPNIENERPAASPKAQARADIERQELEAKLRQLLGRVEELENEKNLSSNFDKKKIAESDVKIVELETKVKNLEKIIIDQDIKIKDYEMQLAQVAQVAAASAALSQAENSEKAPAKANSKVKSLYEKADDSFNQKDYKKAILEFNQFRDENPKSKKLSSATYKIAVSFHELGMKEEAKAFYQEILEKYPKTAEAGKAKFRLKQLK